MLSLIFIGLVIWAICAGRKAYLNVQLMDACNIGNAPRVDKLVRTNVDINARDAHGFTPLILAAYSGHMEVVRILLSAGANPHLTDNRGVNATMYALSQHHLDVVELIENYKNKSQF